jgi:hypothetical protein
MTLDSSDQYRDFSIHQHNVNRLVEENLSLFVPDNGCELAFDLASQGNYLPSKRL